MLLFEDEATFYRQPTQAWLWARLGRVQPRLRYSCRSNCRMRVVATLDAVTGAVHAEQTDRVSADRLARYVAGLSARYPVAETIWLVWDNWPVHAHTKVLSALARQQRVKVLWLPTYAPWLNPIEKAWRWTRQQVVHAHPWCDDFGQFRRQVMDELGRLSQGSAELLRYVGLSI